MKSFRCRLIKGSGVVEANFLREGESEQVVRGGLDNFQWPDGTWEICIEKENTSEPRTTTSSDERYAEIGNSFQIVIAAAEAFCDFVRHCDGLLPETFNAEGGADKLQEAIDIMKREAQGGE